MATHKPKVFTPEEIKDMHEQFPLNCMLLNYTPTGKLLTTVEAAELCNFKPNTFEINRGKGKGPAYIQPEDSRRILYSETVLLAWLVAGFRNSTYTEAESV